MSCPAAPRIILTFKNGRHDAPPKPNLFIGLRFEYNDACSQADVSRGADMESPARTLTSVELD